MSVTGRLCVLAVLGVVATGCGTTTTGQATPGTTTTLGSNAATVVELPRPSKSPTTAAEGAEPVFPPVPDPVLVDQPPVADAVLVVSGDAFDQPAVSIPIGGVVTVRSGDDGTHSIAVQRLSSVTVTGALEEYFRFTASGTYAVWDELTDATATVVVG